jgi:hypothetical protein
MGIALHPLTPTHVYGITKAGQVFATQNGGSGWTEFRMPAGVGDCYAIACA